MLSNEKKKNKSYVDIFLIKVEIFSLLIIKLFAIELDIKKGQKRLGSAVIMQAKYA